jgi:hypothetical protein
MLTMKLSKYWLSADHHEFELMSTYIKEDIEWARYRDILNDKEYNCLLEAFLARFYPTVD